MISDRTFDPMAPAKVARAQPGLLLSGPALCGARTRQGSRCGNIGMTNGRCRFHGGLSTGPKTAEGVARWRAAVTTHGNRTTAAREFRALVRQLRAEARRMIEMA